MPGKWGLMYMYQHDPSLFWHGTYTWPLTFLAWHIYMTPHFPGMVHIHDSSLSWHGTYTWLLTYLAWYIYITPHFPGMWCICTMPGKWGVMYMYHARKVRGDVYVPCQERAWYIYMTPHFPGMVHIHDPSLSWHGTYTSPLTFLALYRVMYMYHARKVRGHVYVPCQESEGWCICVRNINMYHARKVKDDVYVLGISICTMPGKWGVMYMYHARKVRGHVYVPCQESEESCICTMPGKWAVMGMVHIHDPSLSSHGTYT
jgi:hypothetical protein